MPLGDWGYRVHMLFMTGEPDMNGNKIRAAAPRDKDEFRLSRQFDEFERHMPVWFARLVNWLRRPGVQLIRIPLGTLLVIGGIFSILPVLGLWMLPLGLLILALDVRLLRGPVTQSIIRSRLMLRRRRMKKAAQARRQAEERQREQG